MMNRIVKFRAWDGREFINDYYNQINYIAINGGKLVTVQYDDVCPEGVVYGKPEQVALMQFTELCDVNGVEVYEGDIVYVAGLGNAVVRIAYHCGVYYETADDYQSYSDCAAEGDYPTVIGNLYQNPELLE
jgi:hypothetical protein